MTSRRLATMLGVLTSWVLGFVFFLLTSNIYQS